MKKIHLIAIILMMVLIFGALIFKHKLAQAPTENGYNQQNQQSTEEEKYVNLPLKQARDRVLKKPFGIKITPQTSPIQPEQFSGYHTGIDYEIFAGEENVDIAVYAICEGELLQKRTVSGYGGTIIQSCELNSQNVTVLYGHIRLAGVIKNAGDTISQGEQIAILGKDYSAETDNERKHLHLGIRKGAEIDLRGYVETEQELINWIDFEEFVKNL